MKRTYANTDSMNHIYFVGTEVEHTKMFGERTLFVRGFQNYLQVVEQAKLNNVRHIFFGADHSYDPVTHTEQLLWQMMIKHCLDEGYICSIDIPQDLMYDFVDSELQKDINFHPQIICKLPHIEQYNTNTHIKIDDRAFKESNSGVWTVQKDNIVSKENFTSWNDYQNDKAIL